MIETKRETIRGFGVEVTQFPAMHAIRLQRRLAVVVPALANALGAIEGKSVDEAVFNGRELGDSVQRLLDSLPAQEFVDLVRAMLASTTIDNRAMDKEENINFFFSGPEGNKALYETLQFVYEVNFGPLPVKSLTSFFQTSTASGTGEASETKSDGAPSNA